MAIPPELAADLALVIARTGHRRYAELCDPAHPAYRPGYAGVVRRRAAELRGEPAPAILPPGPPVHSGLGLLLSVHACDYRLPLPELRHQGSEGIANEGGCGCSALCLADRATRPDGLVARECFACDLAGPRH